MKLFSRYNRINIAASIIVFVVGSVVFYFVLRAVLLKQLDDTLHTEQTEIISYVKLYHQLPEQVTAYNQQITYEVISNRLPETGYYSEKKKPDGKVEWIRIL